MIIMNKVKIHQHQSMVHLRGHLEVDRQDVVVVVDQWNNVQNQMKNGVIMMIDLVFKKMNLLFVLHLSFFFFQGSSNNYESNQQRSGGWRTNSSMSDRDLNSRRPQAKRDRKIMILTFGIHIKTINISRFRYARMDG
jgi:hypothetical protein